MPELKNLQHEKFCQHLHKSGNQTQSAIEAGYSPNSARGTASRLLTNANIKARMKELQGKAQKKHEYTVEKLVEELDEIEELAKQPIHGKDQNNYDLTNWLKIKSEKAKLFGLYAPTKNDTTHEIKDITSLNIKIR
ncbi:MAG: terminase small subunit [Fusobacteriaceae bacterium]